MRVHGVPVDAVDGARVADERGNGLLVAHVPHEHLVVLAATGYELLPRAAERRVDRVGSLSEALVLAHEHAVLDRIRGALALLEEGSYYSGVEYLQVPQVDALSCHVEQGAPARVVHRERHDRMVLLQSSQSTTTTIIIKHMLGLDEWNISVHVAVGEVVEIVGPDAVVSVGRQNAAPVRLPGERLDAHALPRLDDAALHVLQCERNESDTETKRTNSVS